MRMTVFASPAPSFIDSPLNAFARRGGCHVTTYTQPQRSRNAPARTAKSSTSARIDDSAASPV
jgi:hypothetical protein